MLRARELELSLAPAKARSVSAGSVEFYRFGDERDVGKMRGRGDDACVGAPSLEEWAERQIPPIGRAGEAGWTEPWLADEPGDIVGTDIREEHRDLEAYREEPQRGGAALISPAKRHSPVPLNKVRGLLPIATLSYLQTCCNRPNVQVICPIRSPCGTSGKAEWHGGSPLSQLKRMRSLLANNQEIDPEQTSSSARRASTRDQR